LLSAYFDEFIGQDDDVVLVVLTSAYHGDSDFEDQAEAFAASQPGRWDRAKLPRVLFHPKVEARKQAAVATSQAALRAAFFCVS